MRTISSTILDQIDNAVAIPRSLYHLELQDKSTGATNHIYLTNHEANLTFGGIEYQSYKVKHSNIKTYLKNQTDNCNITMDNVDRGFSSYFAYNEFAGQNATILKIFLDSSLNPIGTYAAGDYIVQFQGMMDRPKVNEESCEVRVVNIFNREQSYTPWRRFSAKCNWDFCGTECGYNSGNGKARGTATHAGTTTTLRDTGLGTFATDYWKGASLKILSGTNKGDVRYISGYNATTKTFTVESAFPLATDTTSKYIVECDKSKSTCKGYYPGDWGMSPSQYGNEGNFGGFEETYKRRFSFGEKLFETFTSEAFVPLVYGEGAIEGQLLDANWTDHWVGSGGVGRAFYADFRLYTIAEGTISSVVGCTVDGEEISVADFSLHDGSQDNFLFPNNDNADSLTYDRKFYRKTALAFMQGGLKGVDVPGMYPKLLWSQEKRSEVVRFSVKGLKVQKYNSNGTTDGSPVWSQNPVWCLLDFLINRASKKLDPAYINFAYAKAAADLCDTLGYKLNLVIKDQKKDTEIIDLMLATCRGYNTYQLGKMEVNLERVWVHPTSLDSMPAHIFEDASNPAWAATTKKSLGDVVRKTVDNGYRYKCTVSGTTGGTEPTWPTTIGNTVVDGGVTWTCIEIADNIGVGSFDYFQEDVNDTQNKIVVKYIDQEIRENMALVSSSLLAGVPITSIPYSDIKGTFATGLMYIGGESFTVTAIGNPLTISSWTPSKTYPKGYAIFQGAQTFSEETAIYHDYDNQDKVKRVIEKEIDGSAIPTYKQAYNIAEYHGRKAVEGNLKCSFKGLMDSLKLTVGDVVKITHALPGWVDAQFRITEASESEDEEVDYTGELYDSSFYAESDLLPSTSLGTTLPNPYAVPGHVTGLSLSEDSYINKDGTYVPTLNITYTLPSGDSAIFWDQAKIQISINGGNYSDYGIDTSRGTGYKIDAATGGFKVGDTVTVRVISISSNNIMADATTAPTLSNKIDALVVAPAAPRGLSIEGNPDPNNTQWDGLRFALTWWKASQTGGAGNEGGLGAGGFTDPYWNGDEYELLVNSVVIDSGTTKEARYDYVYGDGYLDFLDDKIVAANGTLTFKVRRVSLNQPSEWSTITITQAAPATPAGLASDFTGRNLIITWTKATETDFKYYELILNGVTKKLTDPFYTYTLEENIKDNATADPSITYSLKTYDIYGNASSALTGTFTNAVPANPANMVGTGYVKGAGFRWDKNTEADFSGYRVRTKLATDSWSSWSSVIDNAYDRLFTDAESAVYTSAGVYIEVKAIDLYGNESGVVSTNVSSKYVNAEDFDTTAPGVPTGLSLATGVSQGADGSEYSWIRATWTANAESDLQGYEYRIKEDAGNYIYGIVGINETLFSPVRANILHYMGIRAFDKLGNKSGWTADSSTTSAKDSTAPAAPSNVSATGGIQYCLVTWNAVAILDLSHYEVYRNTANDSGTAVKIAEQKDNYLIDGDRVAAQIYYYWVKTKDSSGNVSAFSTVSSATPRNVQTNDVEVIAANKILVDGTVYLSNWRKTGDVTKIDGGQLSTTSILSKTITVQDGNSLDTVNSNAANGQTVYTDPAARINAAAATKINPGEILISGSTYLSDWRMGGDLTKIDGGDISANTVTANKLIIGSRGLSIQGLEISANKPVANTLYWTAGIISYTKDDGTTADVSTTGSDLLWTAGTIYLYWVKDGTSLSTTTDRATAFGTNNVVMATYRGGTDLVVNYGRTIIDGSDIVTGTITADRLFVTTLSSIQSDLGTITAGTITLPSGGHVKAGQTAYATGTGFWLGNDGGTPKLSIGDATKYLKWDGSTLSIAGSITIASGSGIANLTDAGNLAVKDSVDLTTAEVTNKSLANLDSTANTKLSGIETGATVGAAWGTNLTGRPIELTDGRVATALNSSGTVVTKVVPASVAGPGAAGLYLGSDYLGYYSGSAWKTYMQNNGNFYLSGTGTHALTWDGSTLSIRGSLNADDVVAGSIRGIGVYGSTHATKGSYLTATCAASDTTLYIKDTTDFPSSGSGWIIDSANDRDAISWTGKTATTLTGVSGVLAHTVSASNVPVVVPAVKTIVIADVTNEMRFYGDRGAGNFEELASIGRATSGDPTIGTFGTMNLSGSHGVLGQSYNYSGVKGLSTMGIGVQAGSTTGLPLYIAPTAAAPTTNLIDGGIYYNSTDHKFYGRANGTWVAFH